LNFRAPDVGWKSGNEHRYAQNKLQAIGVILLKELKRLRGYQHRPEISGDKGCSRQELFGGSDNTGKENAGCSGNGLESEAYITVTSVAPPESENANTRSTVRL